MAVHSLGCHKVVRETSKREVCTPANLVGVLDFSPWSPVGMTNSTGDSSTSPDDVFRPLYSPWFGFGESHKLTLHASCRWWPQYLFASTSYVFFCPLCWTVNASHMVTKTGCPASLSHLVFLRHALSSATRSWEPCNPPSPPSIWTFIRIDLKSIRCNSAASSHVASGTPHANKVFSLVAIRLTICPDHTSK